MPAQGGEPVQITRDGGFVGRESPDGGWLYYLHGIAATTELRRVPVNGGVEEKVIGAVIQRAFALTSDGIYYLGEADAGRAGAKVHRDTQSGAATLFFLSLRTGTTRAIAPSARRPSA